MPEDREQVVGRRGDASSVGTPAQILGRQCFQDYTRLPAYISDKVWLVLELLRSLWVPEWRSSRIL